MSRLVESTVMKLNNLQKQLLATARQMPPDERVPYAFEKRVMAHLRAGRDLVDHWSVWSRALWRAAAPCVVVAAILCGAWAFRDATPNSSEDFSYDFKTAVLASATPDEAW